MEALGYQTPGQEKLQMVPPHCKFLEAKNTLSLTTGSQNASACLPPRQRHSINTVWLAANLKRLEIQWCYEQKFLFWIWDMKFCDLGPKLERNMRIRALALHYGDESICLPWRKSDLVNEPKGSNLRCHLKIFRLGILHMCTDGDQQKWQHDSENQQEAHN